jgi:hypothetical protein
MLYASVPTFRQFSGIVPMPQSKPQLSGLSPLEDVEELPCNTFTSAGQARSSIWEVFRTSEEAERQAKELKLPGETFTVEQFDGNCPRCSEVRNPRATV